MDLTPLLQTIKVMRLILFKMIFWEKFSYWAIVCLLFFFDVYSLLCNLILVEASFDRNERRFVCSFNL